MTSPRPDIADASRDGLHDGSARERILTSATRLFQEFGYEGTSMTRIARAASMTPAAIYWHFPSKQDVLAEVLSSLYRRTYDVLSGAIPEADAVTRMQAYIRAYVEIQLTELGDHSNFGYANLASSLSPEGQAALNQFGRPYLTLLRDILAQGVEEKTFRIDDIGVTSFAIATMCEYVFTWFHEHGRLTLTQVADHYAELALRMAGHHD